MNFGSLAKKKQKTQKQKENGHSNTKIKDFWVEINTVTCCVFNKLNISVRFLSQKKKKCKIIILITFDESNNLLWFLKMKKKKKILLSNYNIIYYSGF